MEMWFVKEIHMLKVVLSQNFVVKTPVILLVIDHACDSEGIYFWFTVEACLQGKTEGEVAKCICLMAV